MEAAADIDSKGEAEDVAAAADGEATVEASDSKASVSSFSLEDARRSMENSIALIHQAQSESSKEVNDICAKTKYFSQRTRAQSMVSGRAGLKLKNARAVVGKAI